MWPEACLILNQTLCNRAQRCMIGYPWFWIRGLTAHESVEDTNARAFIYPNLKSDTSIQRAIVYSSSESEQPINLSEGKLWSVIHLAQKRETHKIDFALEVPFLSRSILMADRCKSWVSQVDIRILKFCILGWSFSLVAFSSLMHSEGWSVRVSLGASHLDLRNLDFKMFLSAWKHSRAQSPPSSILMVKAANDFRSATDGGQTQRLHECSMGWSECSMLQVK